MCNDGDDNNDDDDRDDDDDGDDDDMSLFRAHHHRHGISIFLFIYLSSIYLSIYLSGVTETVDLIPGGSEIPVDNSNLPEYLGTRLDY